MKQETPDIRQMIYRSMMWKRHRLRTAQNRANHELRYLFFEVSRRCNIHCLYCGSDCSLNERDNEMDTAQWLRIIDELAEDFSPERITVAVTGGEPLYKEGIFDIFQRLHERGFHYGMVSNSTLLTPETASKIVACGMNSISLSVDSIEPVNDRIRGKGMTAYFTKAVKNLRDAGYTGILEALSTITKPCLEHLHEMQTWLESLGIRRWRVAPVMPLGRAARHRELLLDDRDLKLLLDFVRTARGVQQPLVPEFGEEGFLGDRYEGLVRPYLCQCRAGINVGGIRYDGKVGACPEISRSFDQGDIHEKRFSQIWQSGYQLMRDRSWTKTLGACARCEKFSVCRGGALHLYEDPFHEAKRCFYRMLQKE